MNDRNCPFCAIASFNTTDTREIYRDQHCVAFFPVEPATLGHTLVVPKKHVPDIWSCPPYLAAHLSKTIIYLSTAIKRTLAPEGLNIIQSNGAAATQTVFHLHVHIVPRWTNDEMGEIWPSETNFTAEQMDNLLSRLREECRKMPHT